MAFLNFMKKKEDLPNIDLDMPPEPPKMMAEEIPIKEPIDEELMPVAKPKKSEVKAAERKEEWPELPPLPKMEEEMPPLPEEKPKEFGEEGLELPPPPTSIKKEKGFFSFLKPKEAAEKLPLPKIEEEIPPLPEAGEEFPAIPPLPEKEEIPPLPELEKEAPVPSPLPEMPTPEPLKPALEKPIKKFITIDDFKQIQGTISNTKDILKGIDDFFSKLEEVKGIGDKEYLELNNSLQDIQRKIMFVDKTLFKEEV